MPLQDEPLFWLTNRENSNTSQLCTSSNFYDSNTTKLYPSADIYGSVRVDDTFNKNLNDQFSAQEIIANVKHSALKLAQDSIQDLLPKETDHLELSVYCSCTLALDEGMLREEAAKGDKSCTISCARHNNKLITKVRGRSIFIMFTLICS